MTGLITNVSNFVRQEIRVPKSRPLLPVFEAVSNSLDAISERPGPGKIVVTVNRHPTDLDGRRGSPHSFVIEDDGVGFTDENIGHFDQLYTDHKAIRGGKGRGRFTYLKAFDGADITSTFLHGGTVRRRDLIFDLSYTGYEGGTRSGPYPVGTAVTLRGMREPFSTLVPHETKTLAKEFIAHFLPVLLSERDVEIILVDGEELPLNLTDFVRTKLLIGSSTDNFSVGHSSFRLTSAKVRTEMNLRHRIVLAASAREVRSDLLEKFIPLVGLGPLQDDDSSEEYWYVALVEGDYLDRSVDPMRVAFLGDAEEPDDEPVDEAGGDLLGEPRSIRDVRRAALDRIRQTLAGPLNTALSERTKAVEEYIRIDGMGYHFLKGQISEVAAGLKSTDPGSIESALHQAAYNERRRRTDEAAALLHTTPKEKTEESYFNRWHHVVDRLGDVAKSDLANYIAHRRVIIDLVSDAIRQTEAGSYRREEVLHSIIFPRGRQTGEVGYEQQNLWLIDERLTFHEHLFSDISISRIQGDKGASSLRPDLAIYESGFASFHDAAAPTTQLVLVELKQPGRRDASRDDPVSKTLDYVAKLKAGSARTEGGAVIDIDPDVLTTVYILADWTTDFVKYLDREEFQQMPGDVGRYRYRQKERIMMIAVSFERLLEGARRRNRIFFKKLGIE